MVQVHTSPEVNALLDEAVNLCVQRAQYYVGVEHLYRAVLEGSASLPQSVADDYMPFFLSAQRELEKEPRFGAVSTSHDVFYTPRCAATISSAARLAQRLGNGRPTAGHVLLAMLADPYSAPSRALDRCGGARGEIVQALRDALVRSGTTAGPQPESVKAPAQAARREAQAQAGAAEDDLDRPLEDDGEDGFSLETVVRDMTKAAREGKLNEAVGRRNEMMLILEILSRKSKNNVMLVGEAGVGKTQIVEGLALMAAEGAAGDDIGKRRFLELNLAALSAGTAYRGAYEKRVLALLQELKNDPDTVLFIDEAHLLMGAGQVEGGAADLANLVKPALARGELRCIGATTLEEYRRTIEKDPAVERRFQMVRVEPLPDSASMEVLKHLRPSLEEHHGVSVSKQALRAAITLTQRYMPNRHLPDKAIDVLDQACARYRLRAAVARADPEAAATDSSFEEDENRVTPHDIRKVISRITSAPIEEITREERTRIGALERRLKRRIIGQDEAIQRTVAAVKKSRAGLADPDRPDAVMLFLGPTGVGKTQLAKALAHYVFGSSRHLITFDMSEYVEEHAVARLIGAPPGYVGHEEEGRLTAAVRQAPFSILLFDEIEKAHPRVYDILLPLLDEGRVKDARGREVSFRNCMILFTSNVAASALDSADSPADMDAVLAELRAHFRPEFINRIDEIVPFHSLLFEDIRSILGIALRDVDKRLRERGLGLRVYQGAYEYLAEQGYSPEYGARELRRTVDRLVSNPLSDLLLARAFAKGDTVGVLLEDGELVFRKTEPAPESRSTTTGAGT